MLSKVKTLSAAQESFSLLHANYLDRCLFLITLLVFCIVYSERRKWRVSNGSSMNQNDKKSTRTLDENAQIEKWEICYHHVGKSDVKVYSEERPSTSCHIPKWTIPRPVKDKKQINNHMQLSEMSTNKPVIKYGQENYACECFVICMCSVVCHHVTSTLFYNSFICITRPDLCDKFV